MNENICDNNINDIFNIYTNIYVLCEYYIIRVIDIFKENRTPRRKIKSKKKNIANIYIN